MSTASKTLLKEALSRALAEDLATRERSHRTAMQGATHEEAKPENDKDTRALEQSYLARGEARRVEELRAGLAEVQAMALGESPAVALGALVTLVEDGGADQSVFFLAPFGGGTRLGGGRVQVVTPKSPLGSALLGLRTGDECEITTSGRKRTLTIVRLE